MYFLSCSSFLAHHLWGEIPGTWHLQRIISSYFFKVFFAFLQNYSNRLRGVGVIAGQRGEHISAWYSVRNATWPRGGECSQASLHIHWDSFCLFVFSFTLSIWSSIITYIPTRTWSLLMQNDEIMHSGSLSFTSYFSIRFFPGLFLNLILGPQFQVWTRVCGSLPGLKGVKSHLECWLSMGSLV